VTLSDQSMQGLLYRVETVIGVFRLQNDFFSSVFIPCSGVWAYIISLPCGEQKFISYDA